MGSPRDYCPPVTRPYATFASTTTTSTTVSPSLEYFELPTSGINCPKDPCICGSLFVPSGKQYNPSGSYVSINENQYSLSIPSDVLVDKEQVLITTCSKLISDSPLIVNQIYINFGRTVNVSGIIQLVVKIRETKKIIGQAIFGSFGSSTPLSQILINLIDTFNLTNLTLQCEFTSICSDNQAVCCDRLPSSITLTNVISNIDCTTTTTTTTTTLPPFCSSFNLPDSFYATVIGYGDFSGQQQNSLFTRNGSTWSTAGSFPCGANFTLSMTCDPTSRKFSYDGFIDCCTQETKTIIQPTDFPLIFPNSFTPQIVSYSDCFCLRCTTTTTTSTTTTDFPTTPPPPQPIPCPENTPVVLNGYAYYRTSATPVNVPGVGSLTPPCFGGHVCDRTDFLPQLVIGNTTINAQPISMNNASLQNKNVDATFSFAISDPSQLSGGASIKLKCLNNSGGCHTGVTWIVLTLTAGNSTAILFNSCLVPDALANLTFECDDCCDWDGNTILQLPSQCNNLSKNIQFTKIGDGLWELSDTLCNNTDQITAVVKCNKNISYVGPDSCLSKWEVVSSSLSCATNFRFNNVLIIPCSCDNAPIFQFVADNFNGCNCCACRLSQPVLAAASSNMLGPIICDSPPILLHRVIIPANYSLPVLLNITGGINDDLMIDGESITTDLGLDPGPYPFQNCNISAHTIGSAPGPYQDTVRGGITFPINKRSFIIGCRDIGFGANIDIVITINPTSSVVCQNQINFITPL